MRVFASPESRRLYSSFSSTTAWTPPGQFRNDQEPLEIYPVVETGSGGFGGLPLLDLDPTGYSIRAAISRGVANSADYEQLCYIAAFAPHRPQAEFSRRQEGGNGADEVWVLRLPSSTYGGSFTYSYNSQISAPISATATAAAMQTALQTIHGNGNVVVSKPATGVYLITYSGALSGAALPFVPSISGAALAVPSGLKATLTLSTQELADAFEAAKTKSLSLVLEFEITDAQGNKRTIATPINVSSDAIADAPVLTPVAQYYSTVEADARFLRVSENLADIPDKAAARANLGITEGTTGAAGGDLSGTFPNPELKAVEGLTPGAFTNAAITVDAKGRITQAANGPASMPPSGAASGDLTGNYPAPELAPVQGLTPGSYTNANITIDAKGRVIAAANGEAGGGSGGVPSGAAGGDLTGNYPDPELKAIQGLTPGNYVNAAITVDAKGRVTLAASGPSSMPPNGPAGGDLAGTFPNPSLAEIQGLVAGAYTNPNITVDSKGRILTIANGTGGSGGGTGGSTLTGKTIWVDAANGNNSTAVRGDAGKPFLTLTAALAAFQNGDQIVVRPGTYAESCALPGSVHVRIHYQSGAVHVGTAGGYAIDPSSTNGSLGTQTTITGNAVFQRTAGAPIHHRVNGAGFYLECDAIEGPLTGNAIDTTNDNNPTLPTVIRVRKHITGGVSIKGSGNALGAAFFECGRIHSQRTTAPALSVGGYTVSRVGVITDNGGKSVPFSDGLGAVSVLEVGRIESAQNLATWTFSGQAHIKAGSISAPTVVLSPAAGSDVAIDCPNMTVGFISSVAGKLTLTNCELTTSRNDREAISLAATGTLILKNSKVSAATPATHGILLVTPPSTGLGLRVYGGLVLVGANAGYAISASTATTLWHLGWIYSTKPLHANVTIALGDFVQDPNIA